MKNKNYYDDFDDEDYDFDMDYDWVYDENLEKHKTKDKVKWIITAIAFLLIAVVLVGLCLKVFWKPKEVQDEQPPLEENKIALASTRIAPQAYAENGIDPRAVMAYTITATVEPESATDKSVTWAVAWKEPTSGWANGKSVSDYITLNSATANPVTVSCSQAFAAQAIITCISQSNSELTATCTVDYKERVVSVEPEITISGTTYALSDTPILPYIPDGSLNVSVHKSIGSISETYTVDVAVQFTDECKQWIESNHSQWGTGFDKVMYFENGDDFDLTYILSEYNPDCFFIPYYGGGVYGSMYAGQYFYEYLLPDFNAQDFSKLLFTVTLTDSKGSKTVYEYEAKLGDITVAAAALSISNSGIVF